MSEKLPNAAPFRTRRSFAYQSERGAGAAEYRGDLAISAESVPFLLRRSRSLERTKTSAKKLREAAFRQHRHCVLPPLAYLCVHAGAKRGSRSNYEETTLLRSRHGCLRGNYPERAKNYYYAPLWEAEQ